MTPVRSSDNSSRLAVVETSVADLRASFKELGTEFVKLESTVNAGFAALADKMAARDRAPWGLLISGVLAVVTIMSLIGGLVLAPINAQLTALVAANAKMEADKIGRREVDLLIRYRDLQAAHTEDRLKRLEGIK